MIDLFKELKARAKANKQRIVLPESTEIRTLQAANQVLAEEVADVIQNRVGIYISENK